MEEALYNINDVSSWLGAIAATMTPEDRKVSITQQLLLELKKKLDDAHDTLSQSHPCGALAPGTACRFAGMEEL